MIEWDDVFYFSIGSAALLLSLVGIGYTLIVPSIDRWHKRFFLIYFITFMLCCFINLLETGFYYCTVPSSAIYFLLVLEAILLSFPLPMLTLYLLHCCGDSRSSSRLLYTVFGMWGVYLVLMTSATFVNGFSYLTSEKEYYRGPLYPLLVLPLICIQLLNTVGLLRRRKRLSPRAFYSFVIALAPMTIALFIQLFVDVFPLLEISCVLSAIAMHMFILSDQVEQNTNHLRDIARQQQEIANQRASILVLQMRPHFIYNTMISIYCLCNQDSQKARQVITDFTTYLRKNFTAIASSEPITFSSELEHTRAYLAVEQAQYEDSLFVDYDISHTWFRIPPLTLQPIVENCIKHGRDPYAGPFHITIRTRKTDLGSEIVVEDNGRGFQQEDTDETKDPGIALKNIQQRLEIMSGGSLSIKPGDSGGCVVTITIPDNGNINIKE